MQHSKDNALMSALGQKSRHFAEPPRCPLFTQKRALASDSWMSALCQQRTKGIAAKQRYSITSSALASSDCGMVRPIALALLRLIASANLVGAWTGRSVGLAPFNMRSTYPAARRYWSIPSGPYEIRPPPATINRSE